jgi:hypothetical protein
VKRGQSTIELALLLPVMVLLIAGTLQVGVLISDQLALNQAAYEGGLWAVANPGTATVDGGTPGSISRHILAQLCGSRSGPPSTDGTRFCSHTQGVPDITVSTTSRTSSLALAPALPFVTDAYADACNPWRLGISPASATITAGSTQVITVTLTVTGGGQNDPTVTLFAGGYPANLANGNPTFNPPSITISPANVSRLNVATRVDTPPGTYRITISGQDDCGGSPNAGSGVVSLTVNAPAAASPSPSPSPSPAAALAVSAVSPNSICSGTATSIAVTGSGFVSGATVTAGANAATSVTVTSPSQLTAAFPALTAGTYNITVALPSGASASLVNALTVAAACPTPSPPASSGTCAAGSGRYQTVITITFSEPLIAGLTSATPYVPVTARQVVYCQ